jgi:hypothetical protein
MRNSQPSTDVDYLADRLTPLFTAGHPVAITMQTPVLTRGSTEGKMKDHLLTITPGSALGWARERFVVAVIGQGSTIVVLDNKRLFNRKMKLGIPYSPKVSGCVRAGIPAKLATVLICTLQKLYMASPAPKATGTATTKRTFKEIHHGTSDAPIRRPVAGKPQFRAKYGPKPRGFTDFDA